MHNNNLDMIWAFDYLNAQQLKEVERLNPLMDFAYVEEGSTYLFRTFCAGYQTIYENDQCVEIPNDGQPWHYIPLYLIDCYPNEQDCVDNVPRGSDSYGYLMKEIKRGNLQAAFYRTITVTPRSGRFLTIEKTRLKVFREAQAMGYQEFSTVPAGIVKSLQKEIRRIRLFRIENTKQGFICNDWEEASILSMYLTGVDRVKERIEGSYKWIPDYLSLRKNNVWLKTIAVPVTEYLRYFADNSRALEEIDLDLLFRESNTQISPR